MIGTTELLITGLVILVLFGAAAIPKFARSLGRAKKEFQEGLKEGLESSVDKGEAGDEKDKNRDRI